MSNARSPRLVCSTTMGTSCMYVSTGSFMIVLLPLAAGIQDRWNLMRRIPRPVSRIDMV
jgi:hypothetical protein